VWIWLIFPKILAVRVTLGFFKKHQAVFFLKNQFSKVALAWLSYFIGLLFGVIGTAKRLTNRKFDLSLTQLLVKAIGQFDSA